ncbi:CCA tRNA nucleotidyltransferase [Lawsonibacter sp. OA9]|uniref:CCA tRNA nucleotidyltransferase n=1 Tax=Oscillospiraceae TaxID=216572 RepID=UPI001F05CF17|nr:MULTISPECIES: CCA tRNA nucleotidyltransferase [Oscillospiraceae]MCH1978236.1 CCA tRNA nucleotidyltransferase [Lawsonibacter sp. OA9]MCH1981898.1 CCA tRNA nucleotidyltransferase [Ruminococcus sp. OA3]
MRLRLPPAVWMIIDKLTQSGYEAYAVGGCVRDSVLDRSPDDWDITTSATPGQVKELFRHTVDTGLAHGTVTVLVSGEGFEVTTYRIDGKYEDGRHPKDVTFTPNLSEDLKRRDFTINAMAYSPAAGLIDIFGGMQDLQRHRIRCVGEPAQRFSEDALRILRAVRFSAQLGFTIEENTRKAIRKLAPTLSKISAERIQTELVKLLMSPRPTMIREAYETGITAAVLPEFDEMMCTPQNNPDHVYSVGEHTLEVLRHIEKDKVLRIAALLHDVGKPAVRTTDENGVDHFNGHHKAGADRARSILKRLKFDNDTIEQVKNLVYWHDTKTQAEERLVRRAVHRIGEDLFPRLLKLQYADTMAQSGWYRQEKLRRLEGVSVLFDKIVSEKQCVSLKTLKLSGGDLMALGMKPGPKIGIVLQEALEEVLDDPARNTREYLLAFAGKKTAGKQTV